MEEKDKTPVLFVTPKKQVALSCLYHDETLVYIKVGQHLGT